MHLQTRVCRHIQVAFALSFAARLGLGKVGSCGLFYGKIEAHSHSAPHPRQEAGLTVGWRSYSVVRRPLPQPNYLIAILCDEIPGVSCPKAQHQK
ncbi:hypothetical protein QBC46DRAFT_376947 [Diplogelasinospora grovesii]|uniref:Secreted protein n=1 Tax=Diplogelasinospora grovesii TaxID=303347 RepID=A0AAN6NF93_9PEZI|nr:hypothetical protein QBC46DRAFT_376947 [Diplogelasinospora grovesii]